MNRTTISHILATSALAAAFFASNLSATEVPTLPVLPKPIIPACKHWDKIVFEINDYDLAKKFYLRKGDPYDIKVLDDPKKIADLKANVLAFLYKDKYDHSTDLNKIKILSVSYAIDCGLDRLPTIPTR